VEKYFEAIDTNKDGLIDFDEFIAPMFKMTEETISSVFAMLDKNNDGTLCIEELKVLFKSRESDQTKEEKIWVQFMSQVAGKDGNITKEDFKKTMANIIENKI